MSRKLARIGMMQVLFVMHHNRDFSLETMEKVLETPRDEDEVYELYKILDKQKRTFKRDLLKINFSSMEREYIRENIPKLLDNLNSVDEKISDNLRNWSIERLAQVDLAILRIAVYEFLFKEDIPQAVSINEAIEMAKIYSSPDSSRFINGILGSILQEKESVL